MDTPLIRILLYEDLKLPVSANLLNDDRFFKNKILFVELSYYTEVDRKLLHLICKNANYILIDYSDVNKYDNLEFVKFFINDEKFNGKINNKKIDMLREPFNTPGPGYKEKLYRRKYQTISYLSLMYRINYILICNSDRFIVTEHGVHPLTHIKNQILCSIFPSSYFQTKNFTLTGNISFIPFTTTYGENSCIETGNIVQLSCNKNKSLLKMNELIKNFKGDNKWDIIDVLLMKGYYAPKHPLYKDERRLIQTLGYGQLNEEIALYIKQRTVTRDLFKLVDKKIIHTMKHSYKKYH